MANRTQYGGKGVENKYDPQIGIAAAQNAAVSAKAEAFAEDYYRNTVAPLNKKMQESADVTAGKLNTLYDLNADQMRSASERYKQYGIPAEQRYFDMATKYSEPEEQERQAQLAKGDLGVATQNQQQARMRQFAGLGIDPSSPAAISAATDASVMNAAAEAGAMNRSRGAARELGMRLTSDAANFGRGGQSGILQFGGAAQGNAQGSFGTTQGALGSALGAGQFVNQGYGTALQGYGNNLSAYTSLGNTSMNAQAAQNAAVSGAIGSAIGAGAGLAALKTSDIRCKHNIRQIGNLPSGIKVYSFEYLDEFKETADDDGIQIGVMAQEVLPIIPEAISMRPDGYMMVNYALVR